MRALVDRVRQESLKSAFATALLPMLSLAQVQQPGTTQRPVPGTIDQVELGIGPLRPDLPCGLFAVDDPNAPSVWTSFARGTGPFQSS
jgi:hypothetical protein